MIFKNLKIHSKRTKQAEITLLIGGIFEEAAYLPLSQVCFALDTRSQTLFQVTKQSFMAKKYMIKVEAKPQNTQILTVSQNERLMCVQVKPNKLKVISDLTKERYTRVQSLTLDFKEGQITSFEFFEANKLLIITSAGKAVFVEVFKGSKRLLAQQNLDVVSSFEKVDCAAFCKRKQFLALATSTVETSSLSKLQLYRFDRATNKLLLASEVDFRDGLEVEDTPSFNGGRKANSVTSSERGRQIERMEAYERYGKLESRSYFGKVVIARYKNAMPIITAFQRFGSRGVFTGVFDGKGIQEVCFRAEYHASDCYPGGVDCYEGKVFSFGGEDGIRVLELLDTNF